MRLVGITRRLRNSVVLLLESFLVLSIKNFFGFLEMLRASGLALRKDVYIKNTCVYRKFHGFFRDIESNSFATSKSLNKFVNCELLLHFLTVFNRI